MNASAISNNKLQDFKALVESTKSNENAIQAFMEANTAFLPTPNLLNHGLHMDCVIAKFPIGERYTDFAYLTKSTISWRLVLVELEDSGKSIFKQSSKNNAFTAEFGDAVAQIDIWRDFLSESLNQIKAKLSPLMVPPVMATNKLEVQYVLVIGRSNEFEHHAARRLRLANYGTERNLTIMTYDTILRGIARGENDRKAIVRATSRGYRLQSVERIPEGMFAHMKPEHLELAPAVEEILRSKKFDMDAWSQNKPLIINNKWAPGSPPELYDELDSATRLLLFARSNRP